MAEDGDDLRWIRATANELNNLLQVITESAEVLEGLLKGQTEAEKYLSILRASTQRAAATTRAMTVRAGGEAPGAPSASPAVTPSATEPTTRPAGVSSVLPPPIEIHNPTGSQELIMIVDDEDFITLLARKVLAEEGYRVITARNGFQALEIYRKLKDEIALVVLDFTMPIMDGADLFAELQQLNPRVPVVLSSGFTEQDKLRGMLARGLRGFIPKPYTQAKLLAQVRQTLDAISAERA
jgi:CheY-like chemotaxis protein